ncbi:rhodanese-like domain-containing protein [Paenibacillus sp. FSL M8-0142]|uniref:rhodanese-like domain-containing protein n=1 Tax=Paenibacillus sp. FSL M8-0142 TaxID=2954525 RepID=UPI003159F45F
MLIAFAFLIAAFVVLYRRYVPIADLQLMKCSDLQQARKECPDLKLLDVRDVSEFTPDPHKEMINISLGRLPYVWEKELRPGDHVVIVTPKRSDGFLAARKLKKAGFRTLSYLQEDCKGCQSVRRPTLNS